MSTHEEQPSAVRPERSVEGAEPRRWSNPDALLCAVRSIGDGRQTLVLAPDSDDASPVRPEELMERATDRIRVELVPVDGLLGSTEGCMSGLLDPCPDLELVVVIPPFGRRRNAKDPRDPFAVCLTSALQQVNNDIPVVVLLPASTAAGGRRLAFPGVLADRTVRTVVEFERQVLFDSVHPRFRLVLAEFGSDVGAAVFLRITDQPIGDLGTLVSQVRSGKAGSTGFVVPTGELDLTLGLLPRRHDPSVKTRIESAAALGELVELKSLYRLDFPPRIMGRSHKDTGIPVLSIDGKAVGRDGVLNVDFAEEVDISRCLELREGDIVMREFNQPSTGIVSAVVRPGDTPLYATGHVVVLRPTSAQTVPDSHFMCGFVRSSRFADQLGSFVAGSIRLEKSELERALVPVPAEDHLEAVASVETAAQRFATWARECSEVLDFSFEAEDLEAARAQLVTQSRILRQRSDEASKLDDLDHRVLTRYPLPVAYRWRTALAAIGSPEELRSVVHAQEVLFAYLSVVVYAAGAANSCEVAQARDVARRLGQPQRGLGLGDWRAFLQGAAEARTFRKLPSTSPFVEVRDVLKTQESIDAANYLADVRNDLSHLREFGPGEISVKLSESWRNLRLLAAAAAFISEYDLVRVTGTSWDAFRSVNTVEFRRLMGDSPVVPVEQGVVESSEIESGSLYLADGKGQLHLLRPILIGDECKHCGHWSTFMPDRGLPGGLVEYKSLEHGHSLSGTPEMTSALTSVGWWSDGSS